MFERKLLKTLIIDAVVVINFVFLAFSVNAYAKTVLNPHAFGYIIIDPLTYFGIVVVFSYPVISHIYAYYRVKRKLKL